MNFAPELRSHAQKVCNLYKRAMRNLESYYVARNEFDKTYCIKDPKEQRRLLRVAEHEFFLTKNPFQCAKFANSYGIAGGVAVEREVQPPDWVLDYWHPLEKARYPYYFACREHRKNHYIKNWNDDIIR